MVNYSRNFSDSEAPPFRPQRPNDADWSRIASPNIVAWLSPFRDAAQSSPELIKQFLNDVPMRRFGEPEEIGELVLFICSDACEFMTADTVYVNGGGGWR